MEAVDAEVVVSKDADALKKVCDETGRSQQVYKSHVGRNTEALVTELSALIGAGQDHSLATIGITPEQALNDLGALKEMIHTRRPEDQSRRKGSDGIDLAFLPVCMHFNPRSPQRERLRTTVSTVFIEG